MIEEIEGRKFLHITKRWRRLWFALTIHRNEFYFVAFLWWRGFAIHLNEHRREIEVI